MKPQDSPTHRHRVAVDTRFEVVPQWVEDSAISDRAFRLYYVLRTYAANDTGEAWPSRATLARRLRCSVASLDRAMVELVEAGAVTVCGRRRDDGGQTSNLITVRSVPHHPETPNPPSSPVRTPLLTDDEPPSSPMTNHELDPGELDPPSPRRQASGEPGCPAHAKPHRACRACGTSPRAVQRRRPPRPRWCGECDEATRLLDHGPDSVIERCPTCHPLRAHQETPSS